MPDHRSLEAWKEARVVALGVLEISRNHWQPWAGAMFSQLQRASLSVQLNIAEGWSFGHTASRTRYLGIAYGSAIEAADLIDLMADAKVLSEEAAVQLRSSSSRCQRLLVGLLKRCRPRS
ncbi:MAG TPA: four helix bundle protein [Gemmatimonadales bacterium]|nr:four helix bundle protein [Gemmatimonadales bacterium]